MTSLHEALSSQPDDLHDIERACAQGHAIVSVHAPPGVKQAALARACSSPGVVTIDLDDVHGAEDALRSICLAIEAPAETLSAPIVAEWLRERRVPRVVLLHATRLRSWGALGWLEALSAMAQIVLFGAWPPALSTAHDVSVGLPAPERCKARVRAHLEAHAAGSEQQLEECARRVVEVGGRVPLALAQLVSRAHLLGLEGVMAILDDEERAYGLLALKLATGASLPRALERVWDALGDEVARWWRACCVSKVPLDLLTAQRLTGASMECLDWFEQLQRVRLMRAAQAGALQHLVIPPAYRLVGWYTLSEGEHAERLVAQRDFFTRACLERAAALLQRDEDALGWVTHHREVLLELQAEELQRATEAAREAPHPFPISEALVSHAYATTELLPVEIHRELLERVTALEELAPALPMAVRVIRALGAQGRLDLATRHGEHLVARVRASRRDPLAAGKILGALANAHRARGELQEAASLWEECLDLLAADEHAIPRARAQMNLGVLYMDHGDLERARGPLERARELFESQRVTRSLAFAHHNLSIFHRDLGGVHTALTHAERSLSHYEAHGEEQLIVSGAYNLDYMRLAARFVIHHAAAQLETSIQRNLERSLALERSDMPTLIQLQRADLLIDMNHLERAHALLHECLQRLPADHLQAPTTARMIALVEMRRGEVMSARAHLEACFETFTRLEAHKDAALTAGHLAVLSAEQRREQEVEAWLERARHHSPASPRHAFHAALEAMQTQALYSLGRLTDEEAIEVARRLILGGHEQMPVGFYLCNIDARQCAHGLMRALPTEALRCAWGQVFDPSAQRLLVAEDGTSLRAPGASAWVDLSAHPVLAQTLSALLEEPERGRSMQELLEDVYGDEAASLLASGAGPNRVYKSISLLRSRGLEACLERRGGRYVLTAPRGVTLVPVV